MEFKSHFDSTTALTAMIIGTTTAAIGLVLNSLNLFVLMKSAKVRKNLITSLIGALAMSDIAFCFSLSLYMYEFYYNEPYPEESVFCYYAPICYR